MSTMNAAMRLSSGRVHEDMFSTMASAYDMFSRLSSCRYLSTDVRANMPNDKHWREPRINCTIVLHQPGHDL